MKTVALAFGALFIAACSRTYRLEGGIPSPVIEPLPLNAAVYYPEPFRKFSYKKESSDRISYELEVGAAQEELFRRLFQDIFETVVDITDIKAAATLGAAVDLVIGLTVDDFAVATPIENGSEFYEVSVRYGLSLYTSDGKSIVVWSVNGYGRDRQRTFVPFSLISEAAHSVSKAAQEAIRDAATVVAVEVKNTPEVKLLICEQKNKPTGCKQKPAK